VLPLDVSDTYQEYVNPYRRTQRQSHLILGSPSQPQTEDAAPSGSYAMTDENRNTWVQIEEEGLRVLALREWTSPQAAKRQVCRTHRTESQRLQIPAMPQVKRMRTTQSKPHPKPPSHFLAPTNESAWLVQACRICAN